MLSFKYAVLLDLSVLYDFQNKKMVLFFSNEDLNV